MMSKRQIVKNRSLSQVEVIRNVRVPKQLNALPLLGKGQKK